jgi:hypothetical protein
MKMIWMALSWGMVAAGWGWAEENSAQRLEAAQRNTEEASWPRKPDNRMSPLSGKMKEMREISPRYYGEGREFRAKTAEGWQKEASLGKKDGWSGAEGRAWEEERWTGQRGWAKGEERSEKFQTSERLAAEETVKFRQVEKMPAGDWSSRTARLGGGRDGSLRMYEGRLTRVREQVQSGDAGPRDLGPGRQEQFRPEEVERMLADPMGERGEAARGQSRGASRHAAADN